MKSNNKMQRKKKCKSKTHQFSIGHLCTCILFFSPYNMQICCLFLIHKNVSFLLFFTSSYSFSLSHSLSLIKSYLFIRFLVFFLIYSYSPVHQFFVFPIAHSIGHNILSLLIKQFSGPQREQYMGGGELKQRLKSVYVREREDE